MKESILHYVWQNKLFKLYNLKTTNGDRLEIIDVGRNNTDAGPDFFNAKIKINETVWAGNIEIHINSTDWKKHNHQLDDAYNNVVLHVVLNDDCDVYRTDGEQIPQLKLVFPNEIEANYNQLINQKKWIPCFDKIDFVPSIIIESWKNTLLTERLEQKMNVIESILSETNHHWEEAFYITLARSFGFGTNSQAFEALAKSLPLVILAKHKDQLFQLEALLFGQSGLLNVEIYDDYSCKLNNEYVFLRAKYNLQPIESSQWKLLRLRPDNFPHIRIAQFASLIHSSSKLFSKIKENPEINYVKQLFDCEPSLNWNKRYTFAKESALKTKRIGEQSINLILINTIVPFLFCYASYKNDECLKNKTLELLEEIPSERNSIMYNWQKLAIKTDSAFDSQALLQLKKHYCDEKKCLRCRIGHKVLTLSDNK